MSIFLKLVKIDTSWCKSVKIEGGQSIPYNERLVDAGYQLGHIGLMPQQIKNLGNYRKFGKSDDEAEALIQDAIILQNAGCFALIGEMIDDLVAAKIAKRLNIPFIGIGSGIHCDGQILVSNDLLGLTNKPVPNFVHMFNNLSRNVIDTFIEYKNSVIEGNVK